MHLRSLPAAICILMCIFVLSGCFQETEQIVVPVAGPLPDREQQKQAMRENLSKQFPKLSKAELDAIDSIMRGLFVTDVARHRSYMDYALPIGSGQSTLKLSDIGFILSELGIKPTDKILEIGTGTGYLTAILSRLCANVYSMEINEYLSEIAMQNMNRLSLTNVKIKNGDGLEGWPRFAPFDVIIFTASVSRFPPGMSAQLNADARIAIPVNDASDQCKWSILHYHHDKFEEVASRETHIAPAIVPIVPDPSQEDLEAGSFDASKPETNEAQKEETTIENKPETNEAQKEEAAEKSTE